MPKILTVALEPAAGQRVEMAEVYRRYNVDCAAEGILQSRPGNNQGLGPEPVQPLKPPSKLRSGWRRPRAVLAG